MSVAPRSIVELGTYWSRHGGVMLGVVGNDRHCSGYHLGRDRIFSRCACRPDGTCEPGQGDKDYSVSRSRDRIGLSSSASAIDLGKLDGSLKGLQQFSRWLVDRCQHGAPGTRDVREVIYSPDGVAVRRWESLDNKIHSGPGQGDLSHRTHTHMSFYRDSEDRSKIGLFAPYFEETDVPGIAFRLIRPVVATATVTIDGASLVVPSDGRHVAAPKGSTREAFAYVETLAPIDQHPGDRSHFYLVGRLPTEPVNAEAALLLASAAELS